MVIPPLQSEAYAWNPFDCRDVPAPDCAYLGGVIAAAECAGSFAGLTVYVTWNLRELPSYGRDVVVFALGDEWARLPRYASRVRAVFKTYGTRYPAHFAALVRPSVPGLMSVLQDARVCVARIPDTISARRAGPVAFVYDLPLGYYVQSDVPEVPINDRRFDVYFAGSMANSGFRPWSVKTWLPAPKRLSRTMMLAGLRRVARAHPEFTIEVKVTGGFHATTPADESSYAATMTQTKLCLVPRGTSLETYRFFEGLRYGCVLVTERLPSRWFYDGAPVVRVRDWSEIDRVVPALLRDPVELAKRQRDSLRWWNEVCGEQAVGRYVARRIEASPGL